MFLFLLARLIPVPVANSRLLTDAVETVDISNDEHEAALAQVPPDHRDALIVTTSPIF